MKKVLVLNISTDSKNTSLGFAISWLNAFAKQFDEVHVISPVSYTHLRAHETR